jgi:uncharacterized repeat protein (TIGR03803 family)
LRTSKWRLLGISFGGLVFLSLLTLTVGRAFAASESLLWSFGNGTDGAMENLSAIPGASLIMDETGSLYGTTAGGGTNGSGTAFELKPPSTSGGEWTESVIWDFGQGTDGKMPEAGLIMDKSGNLYGTTRFGGGGAPGSGTVFELTPPTIAGGDWSESVIWHFGGEAGDGHAPQDQLIMDSSGNLYGTTQNGGGTENAGTVFELTPPSTPGANWTESILWSFEPSSGYSPTSGLIMDKSGNLYGTTQFGGTSIATITFGLGTVFQLSPPSTGGGTWTQSVLWNFGGPKVHDGEYPEAALIMDKTGNLYGTTCGLYGFAEGSSVTNSPCTGTVFELSPPANDGANWTETNLWSFSNKGTDGYAPTGGVIMDADRNLYGTTGAGGTYSEGTGFELTPPSTAGGEWTRTVLWSFGKGLNKKGIGKDGAVPAANLTKDSKGNLYSTTQAGGTFGLGTVFEITGAAPGTTVLKGIGGKKRQDPGNLPGRQAWRL